MTTQTMETGYELERAQILTLRVAAGTTITCARGLVWITQDGRREDFWLPAGETLRVGRAAKVVIEAAQQSRIGMVHVARVPAMEAAAAWIGSVLRKLGSAPKARATPC